MARVVKTVLQTQEEREKHVQDFFDWLKEHDAEARFALKKNITFDKEIFEDAYHNAIQGTADSILKNGTYIDDFKMYFFIACKFAYIKLDNKKKNRWQKEDSDYFLNIWRDRDKCVMPSDYQQYYRDLAYDDFGDVLRREEYNDRIRMLFDYIRERLEDQFTPQEVDIFMLYYRLKSEGKGISYKNLSQIMGVSTNKINVTIVAVRKFIKEDEEINKMKKKLIDNYDSEFD